MRKVLFKRYIPRVLEKQEAKGYSFDRTKPGTACWESEFTHEGLFHEWGVAHTETEQGFGNYSVALIELPDGTIEEVLPTNIKFID